MAGEPNRVVGLQTLVMNVLFICAIALPPLVMLLEPRRDFSESENRRLAPFPSWPADYNSLPAFRKGVDTFYGDHFGLRIPLIHLRGALLFYALHTSPSEQVILGKDGWLFYGTPWAIANYTSAQAFTDDELQTWACVSRSAASGSKPEACDIYSSSRLTSRPFIRSICLTGSGAA